MRPLTTEYIAGETLFIGSVGVAISLLEQIPEHERVPEVLIALIEERLDWLARDIYPSESSLQQNRDYVLAKGYVEGLRQYVENQLGRSLDTAGITIKDVGD